MSPLQSGLGRHSAASGYTARINLLVSLPFPPIGIPQLDDQPNGFQRQSVQRRSHWRTPAQRQPHSTFMEPLAPRNMLSGPPPEAASRGRDFGRPSNQEETKIRTILAR